jgi:hypothetical protein
MVGDDDEAVRACVRELASERIGRKGDAAVVGF